jgi:uncharacterized membrane protein (UPF0127 family)
MRHPTEQTRKQARPKSVVTLLIEGRTGAIVCERCTIADTPASRMRGLLGRKGLPGDEGILLQPASSIHTAFMLFPIDVVFLSEDFEVLDVRSQLKPWRTASCRGAKVVVELAAGEAERRGVEVGDRLIVFEAQPAIDLDFADLFERVGAMLADEMNDRSKGWSNVEGLLTEGYAQTLALESERLRIERRLAERNATRMQKWTAQTRSLAARLEAIDRDIHCLRALLAELYDQGRHLRDAGPSSRAA